LTFRKFVNKKAEVEAVEAVEAFEPFMRTHIFETD
jgi:hypothetical protein